MAFAVLMIALIPLSYLFTTSLITAGQSQNQQTALSIAEKWTEVLSNVTPPVNPSTGAVITDTASAPAGPAPSSSAGTIASASNNHALNNSSYSTIVVTSTATFQPATAANQTIEINTGTASNPNYDTVTYSSVSTVGSTVTFTCASSPCSSSTDTLATNDPVVQTTIVTPTETRGNVVYTVKASYSWATAQNSGAGTKPNLCTSGTPALLKLRVTVSWGTNADANNVQDSVMINYPPAGVQTLGFLALQMQGDLGGVDTQSPPAVWSSRVQAIPVTITGQGTTLSVYPDSYGCVFAQVNPGDYTVSVGQPVSGYPSGTTYGTPAFVANAAGTVNANHINVLPTSETNPTGTAVVNVGAVTRLQATLNGDYPNFDQGTIVNLAYPSTSSVEDGVSCPGAGQVVCVTTGENGSGATVTWLNGTSWNNVNIPSAASITRITSVTCAGTVACIAVGYGSNGAVILHSTTGSPATLSVDTLPAVTGLATANAALTSVVCPSASQCVATGYTSTGVGVVLSGTIATGSDTWVSDAVPAGVVSVSNPVCPTTATGCVAIASTSTANQPVLVSGPSGSGAWTTGTFTGFTVSSLSQVTCPTATSCLAIGTGKVGASTTATPVILSGTAGGAGLAGVLAWTADTTPGTTLTSLNQVICPTTTKCLITGFGTQGQTTAALVLYPSATAGQFSTQFPTVTGGTLFVINQVVCPAAPLATTCTAIGTSTLGPALFTVAINGTTTADSWASDALPTVSGSINALSKVVCPATTSCLAMGTGTATSGSPQGYLLATTNGTSWTSDSLPSGDSVLYFDGIDCTQGASATCSAVGATPTGAVILSTTGGPSGTFSDVTPTNASAATAQAGYVTSGVPIEVSNSGLLPTTYGTAVTAGAATNVTSSPGLLLYPFTGGYQVFAGDCQAEGTLSYTSVQAATQPGGTTNITVPMGLLSISVTHSGTGLPYAGATLTLTSTTTGCNYDQYTLQPAGADGLSRTEVPFGTYLLSINGSATPYGTLVVSGSNTVLSGTMTGGTFTLPTPVPASA